MEILHINIDTKKTIINSFDLIASNLILNKQILINESRYSFIDIEFYYWNENHQDDYASNIVHSRPKGEFEIHRFGLDISLGNSKTDFGGILIRGLFDENHQRIITKSHVLKTIYNQLNQGNNRFILIDEKSQWVEKFMTKRLNLGKPDKGNKQEFVDSQYRFLAKDNKIFAKYPDKEDIFRYSDLSDNDVVKILGYKLSR